MVKLLKTNNNVLCLHFYLCLEKKPPLKTFEDVQTLLSQGKKREVKLLIRDNAWPINSTIRSQLWPAICSQHQVGKSMMEGYYWDMVQQVEHISLCLNFYLKSKWLNHFSNNFTH